MSWSREQVEVLIQEYRKFPCLYDIKSKQYSNKHARNSALESVVGTLSVMRCVTTTDIKAKFQALRSNILSEHRKHVNSIKSGAGTDEIYQPTVWYFDLMKFLLVSSGTNRKSYDSLEIVDDSNPNQELESVEQILVDSGDYVFELNDELSTNSTPVSSRAPSRTEASSSEARGPSKKRKRAGEMSNEENFFQSASAALKSISSTSTSTSTSTKPSNPDVEEVDAFLTYLRTKMLKINTDMRQELEKEILEVTDKYIMAAKLN